MSKNIELLSHFGSDTMIVDVARVSYGKEASNYTEAQNTKLLNYLVKHGHTSPFRHPKLQFRVTCPIYVERQLFKHEVGVEKNSISGRYVDFSDSYYEIEQFRYQSTSSKQGSAGDLPITDNTRAIIIQEQVIEYCKLAYSELIALGVSKEQCRSVLPLSLNTTFVWTGSLQAFIHLCNLRLKPDTQKETQDVVAQMLQLVQNIEGNPFEQTLKAFGYSKKEEVIIPEEPITVEENPIWRVICKRGFLYKGIRTASIRTHEWKKAVDEGYTIELICEEYGTTTMLNPGDVFTKCLIESKFFKSTNPSNPDYQLFNYCVD